MRLKINLKNIFSTELFFKREFTPRLKNFEHFDKQFGNKIFENFITEDKFLKSFKPFRYFSFKHIFQKTYFSITQFIENENCLTRCLFI